jgi:hypothetical protein
VRSRQRSGAERVVDDDALQVAGEVFELGHVARALLQRQTVGALQHPETRTKLSEAGFSITGSSRPEAERLLVAEARRWAGVVRSSW